MPYAAIGPIAVCLPEKVEDIAYLKSQYPRWDMDLIYAKTGVRARHIAVGRHRDDFSAQMRFVEAESRFAIAAIVEIGGQFHGLVSSFREWIGELNGGIGGPGIAVLPAISLRTCGLGMSSPATEVKYIFSLPFAISP